MKSQRRKQRHTERVQRKAAKRRAQPVNPKQRQNRKYAWLPRRPFDRSFVFPNDWDWGGSFWKTRKHR